jgi:hypothetical protein
MYYMLLIVRQEHQNIFKKHFAEGRSANSLYIALWKKLGAVDIPKGTILNWYVLPFTENTVLALHLGSIAYYQYPICRSHVENTVAPPRSLNVIYIRKRKGILYKDSIKVAVTNIHVSRAILFGHQDR